ncbi:hypothetical protein XENTR_v10000386 [Xenopus tropicalis]|nr:hypothetical protein XENTR_v10000386 [Xenopus tropicalis]
MHVASFHHTKPSSLPGTWLICPCPWLCPHFCSDNDLYERRDTSFHNFHAEGYFIFQLFAVYLLLTLILHSQSLNRNKQKCHSFNLYDGLWLLSV